jgi:hypothetical protein
VRFCHQVDLLGILFISEVGGGNVPFRAAKQTDRLRPNSGHYDETNFMISTAPSDVSLFFTQSQIRLPRHAVM